MMASVTIKRLKPASVKRNINKPSSIIQVLMYRTVFIRPFETLFLQTKAIVDDNNIKTVPIIRITIPTNKMIENTAIISIKTPSAVSTKVPPYPPEIMYEYKVCPGE